MRFLYDYKQHNRYILERELLLSHSIGYYFHILYSSCKKIVDHLILDGMWFFLDARWKLPIPIPPGVGYFFMVLFAF